ncbi:TPA: DUF2290 domain-containing protein [Bacillus tropicus]|nr:DUF2290 domain-containing protein [Bacillus tropicus]
MAADLCNEINSVIIELIELGVCIDQNYPCINEKKDSVLELSWADAQNLSIALKNIPYDEIYSELDSARNFTVKFIDGALLQLQYTIKENKVVSHRLGFFPNPDLESFQNEPDIYNQEDLYADILARNIVPSPVRFDFNDDDDLHIELIHSKSHATLGQYKNCRIPVFGVLTPVMFVDFILRNFYSHIHCYYEVKSKSQLDLSSTITELERRVIHFNVLN